MYEFGRAYNRWKGVKVGGVYEDTWTESNMVYDPSHPDVDEKWICYISKCKYHYGNDEPD